jgi:hypothetical protein
VVDIVSTAAVTDQVGGEVPSQSSGRPVGPTGGDSPQARAVCARAASTIVITPAVTNIARDANMRDRSTQIARRFREPRATLAR